VRFGHRARRVFGRWFERRALALAVAKAVPDRAGWGDRADLLGRDPDWLKPGPGNVRRGRRRRFKHRLFVAR
jgi:hypothetical protein